MIPDNCEENLDDDQLCLLKHISKCSLRTGFVTNHMEDEFETEQYEEKIQAIERKLTVFQKD